MDTVLMRMSWFAASQKLSDRQWREFITKIAMYGFTECTKEVSSDDAVVDAMLEMVKPQIRQGVAKYLDNKDTKIKEQSL